jgi:hypothetical protein
VLSGLVVDVWIRERSENERIGGRRSDRVPIGRSAHSSNREPALKRRLGACPRDAEGAVWASHGYFQPAGG